MAYVNEGDAGFRMTALSHGSATLLGAIGCTMEKIINREAIKADANNYPVSRPVDEIDARVTAEFLSTDDAISYSATAANFTAAFNQADGGTSGSIVMGAMVAGNVTHSMRRNMGGFSVQQIFELQGSLTYTPTA